MPGSRIVHTFDFEEEKLGNFESIPMYFSKVVGRGYPIYSTAKFVKDPARSAKNSFKLELDGGSVAYQLAPNRIPINPSADYYIIGFVKTTPLHHARAEIRAWFADDAGKLIKSTESSSQRYALSPLKTNDKDANDWHVLHLYMPGQNLANAKSLVLQLGLMQPQQLSNNALGRFELYQQDIKGAAWFDDIVVFQLPRLSVKPPATIAGNIFGPGQKVELDLTVSDLGRGDTGVKLQPLLTITDGAGTAVVKERWSITVDAAQPWSHRYTCAALPPGLYTATLDVADEKSMIARRTCKFMQLAAADQMLRPAARFGIVATSWPPEAWPQLPAILKQTGVGLVHLPAWRRDMSEDALLRKDQPFDVLINAMQRHDIQTLASFSEIPSVLTEKLNDRSSGDSILTLLDADPNVWRPYVSFLLARYTNRVDHWQIGDANDRFFSGDARYAQLYTRTRAELASMMKQPSLIIPWHAFYDFDPAAFPKAQLNLRLPSSIKPAMLPTYIRSFAEAMNDPPGSAPNIIAKVEPLDDQKYNRLERLSDFAQRIVHARAANPKAVLIDLPLQRQTTIGSTTSEPNELFVIYSTLVRNLGDAAFKQELTLAPGIRAFLFERDGAGTIVLFNENAADAELSFDLPLGATPRLVDLFGNTTALTPNNGTTKITVTPMPVLLNQLDPRLTELRCSFALAQAHLPAGAGVVRTQVLLTNPYSDTFTGTLHLQGPRGWTIDPPSMPVAITAKGNFTAPITIRYPYSEFAGPKTIKGRLTLDNATRNGASGAQTLDLFFNAAVVSDIVEMTVISQMMVGANGPELVLQQMVTNITSDKLNAQGYAMVPGFARQQRFILELKPGQTTIKRYVFNLTQMTGATSPEDALKQLSGQSAVLGLRQNDGKVLMTKPITLE